MLKIRRYVRCLFPSRRLAGLPGGAGRALPATGEVSLHSQEAGRALCPSSSPRWIFIALFFFYYFFIPSEKIKEVYAWFLFPNQALLHHPPRICDLMLKEVLVKHLLEVEIHPYAESQGRCTHCMWGWESPVLLRWSLPWKSIKYICRRQGHARNGDLLDTICWDFGRNTYQRLLKRLNSY